MADLIDRDELLKSMGLTDAVKYGNKDAEQQYRSYSTWMSYEIADSIRDAPAVNRWISVEDALPEQSGVYLAYFTFKDGTHATDIAYINTGCHLGSITHWMPLPEPPESEVQ